MGNIQPPFSENQIEAFGVIPRFTSIPSLIGCTYIIQHIVRSKDRLGRVYHRLVLMMTIHDVGWTLKNVLSTWPIPAGFPGAHHAVGTQATCTAVAFIGQGSALGSILYSGGLTLFFLLVIRHGWTERQNVRLELGIHAFCLAVGWGTALAGLPLTLYNPHAISCGIQAYPPRCTQSYRATEDRPPSCTRGDNAGIYVWAFFWAWLWSTFVLVAVCMALIYGAMRRIEARLFPHVQPLASSSFMTQNSISATGDNSTLQASADCISNSGTSRFTNEQPPPPTSERRSVLASIRPLPSTSPSTIQPNRVQHSRNFAVQAGLYCGFFFLTWIFPTISNALGNFADQAYSPLIYLVAILGPLQGFFNFVIYVRPRCVAYRKRRQLQQQQQGLSLRPSDGRSEDTKDDARRWCCHNSLCQFWWWQPEVSDTAQQGLQQDNRDDDDHVHHELVLSSTNANQASRANGTTLVVTSMVESDMSDTILSSDYLM